MKRSRYITASELAEGCVCEQRVDFDRRRGKRRTRRSRQLMQAGTAAHAELHREAQCGLSSRSPDARCFVATALWGTADPRTQALREWRDTWLLKRRCGSAAARLYYKVSPLLIVVINSTPGLKGLVDSVLTAIVRRMTEQRE